MKIHLNRYLQIGLLLFIAVLMRFVFFEFLSHQYPMWVRICTVTIFLLVGAFFVLKGAAQIIEETTEVLSERTKIAGGVLQSIGTAFPDMAIGVVAAIISLRVSATDYALAINYAIIAAATTFGSNIYNIAHAAWCVLRQNIANKKEKVVLMFPLVANGGKVTPISEHTVKPSLKEMDNAIDILTILTLLTATVAVTMVIFGRIENPPQDMTGDLYQMIRPVGFVILALCIGVIYIFRETKRGSAEEVIASVHKEESYYRTKPTLLILAILILSGIAVLLSAESMVHAVQTLSEITHLPYVLTGVFAGIIGCLGEMIVIHNYTVNPKGRIGDALVGVAMDNIVTTMGAAIVAVMGGIFLGGNALILIFVLILTLNTLLIWQIMRLKSFIFFSK